MTGGLRKGKPPPWSSAPWSYSRLRTLYECPLLYWRIYELHEPPPKPVILTVGACIHYMLEKFFELNFKSADTFASAGQHFWLEVADGQEAPEGYGRPPKPIAWKNHDAQKWEWYHKIGKILRGFYQRHHLHRGTHIGRFREVSFTVEAWRGISLTGKMDRFDIMSEGVHMIDYKMGHVWPDTVQSPFYQVGYEEHLRRELFNDLPLLSIASENLFSGQVQPLQLRDGAGLDRFHQVLLEAINYRHAVVTGEQLIPDCQPTLLQLPVNAEGMPVLWSREAGLCPNCSSPDWCLAFMAEQGAHGQQPISVQKWREHHESLRRTRMPAQTEIPLEFVLPLKKLRRHHSLEQKS